MGQILGKAELKSQALPFVGLPRRSIADLLDAYNVIAEGYAITPSEAEEIVQMSLSEYLDIGIVAKSDVKTRKQRATSLASEFFVLLDSDHNSLVDSFEFLSILTLLSACTMEEKFEMILGLYHFDDPDHLTIEEATLALRAALYGLNKIIKRRADESVLSLSTDLQTKAIDRLLGALFLTYDNTNGSKFSSLTTENSRRVTKYDYLLALLACPEISSWVKYVNDCHVSVDAERNTSRFASGASLDIKSTTDLQPTSLEESSMPVASVASNSGSASPATSTMFSCRPEWVYGRNSRGIGKNSFYGLKDNQVIYPAGTMVIQATLGKGEDKVQQEYFSEHSEYVTCVATHHVDKASNHGQIDFDSNTFIASAQLGKSSSIKIWSPETMRSLRTLTTIHEYGVAQIAFSPSGNLLLSVGLDSMHSISIYQWKVHQCTVYTSPSTVTPMESVMDCSFLGSDDLFAVCGDSFVSFWNATKCFVKKEKCPDDDESCLSNCRARCDKNTDRSKSFNHHYRYEKQRGLFGNKIKLQPMACITSANGVVFTGSISGDLCVWDGRCCVQTIAVGTCGAITTCYATPSSFINLCIGTSDGRVHLFSVGSKDIVNGIGSTNVGLVDLIASRSVASFGGVNHYIDSICMNSNQTKLLLGLRSGDLFEMNISHQNDATDSLAIALGLGVGGNATKLSGLALNPRNDEEVVTVGSDQTLRVWNTQQKLARTCVLDTPASCVSFASDGSTIIVGFGVCPDNTTCIAAGSPKIGGHVILRARDLSILKERRDSKNSLLDCKCSRDGNYYAFASEDTCIYIYNADTFTLQHKIRGHTSPVTRIDFGYHRSVDAAESELDFSTSMSSLTNILIRSITATNDVMIWSIADNGKVQRQCSNTERESTWGDEYVAEDQIPFHTLCRGHGKSTKRFQVRTSKDRFFSIGIDGCCLIQWSAASCTSSVIQHQSVRESRHQDKFEIRIAYHDDDQPIDMISDEIDIAAPWRRAISEPSDRDLTPPARNNRSLCRSELDLEFIHGCNPIAGMYYSINGSAVLYSIGRTVVKYDEQPSAGSKTQKFYRECPGEVIAFARHPHKPLCAVIHDGEHPSINIVNYDQGYEMETVRAIDLCRALQSRTACLLKFDTSGTYLAAISAQSLFIIDWENNCIIASSEMQEEALDVEFLPSGDGLVHCGSNSSNSLTFLSWAGWLLTSKCVDFVVGGSGSSGGSCVGFVGNQLILGTDKGYIVRFRDDASFNVDLSIKAHGCGITSVTSTAEGIATGSKNDGIIKFWNPSLCCIRSIDLNNVLGQAGCASTSIVRLSWELEYKKMLVGTSSNEIWEIDLSEGDTSHSRSKFGRARPIMKGHCGDQSIGLSINPKKSTYATVSGDADNKVGVLRIWDLHSHRMLHCEAIEMASGSICHSPDGLYIAIGFGATRKHCAKHLHGKVAIFLESDLSRVEYEMRDCRKLITSIKWSPDGQILAVGSSDTNIYLYNISKKTSVGSGPNRLQAELLHKIEHHNASISAVEFSSDSRFLQVTDSAHQLCFFEISTGKPISESSLLRDVVWETLTVLGWPVQGAWSPASNAIPTSVDCTLSSSLPIRQAFGNFDTLALGYSNGQIKLFSYPCVASTSQAKTIDAHSGLVAYCRWTGGDSHLVTVGSNDKAIMIWRHCIDDNYISEGENDSEGPGIIDACRNCKKITPKTTMSRSSNSMDSTDRPWIRTMIEPSNPDYHTIRTDMPKEFSLKFVHGLQGSFAGADVAYNGHGDLILPCSRYGILYDKSRHRQLLFDGHKSEITALCSSPDLRIVASGSERGQICVWDAQTLKEICTLFDNCNVHQSSISLLAFGRRGDTLVSVSTDSDNTIAVWRTYSGDWRDAAFQATSKGGTQQIRFLCLSTFEIVTGGHRHVNFFEKRGRHLAQKRGVFGEAMVGRLHCGSIAGSDTLLTGTESGELCIWHNHALQQRIETPHAPRAITCIQCHHDRDFVTGGGDGIVIVWRMEGHNEELGLNVLHTVAKFQVEKSIPVRSIAIDRNAESLRKLLLSTTSCHLYELSVQTGDFQSILSFHSTASGIATHPLNPDLYCTVGDDATLRIYSISANKIIRMVTLPTSARAVCWSSDGRTILVGCGSGRGDILDKQQQQLDGTFLLLDDSTLDITYRRQDFSFWVSEARFSEDDSMFALAAADKIIYIYHNDKARHFPLKSKIISHNHGPISSLDFSVGDAFYLQSSSAPHHEVLLSNTENGDTLLMPSQRKTINLATWTSPYGWPVQGLWSLLTKSCNEPIAIDRSSNRQHLAVGRCNGDVMLFNYPVISKNCSSYRIKHGHTGPLKCKFNCNGKHLITVGRNSVLVWSLT